MITDGNGAARALCPRCREPLSRATVRTAIWQGDRLAVVEDIPAEVCGSCGDQYYDDDVTDALRALNETRFPEADADRVVTVPVFSLSTRIRTRVPLPEDVYVE